MLKRKAYQQLLNWKKSSKGESALLIEGARRVGKSTVAEEFGKNEYRSYLVIDFSVVADDVKELFTTKRDNIDSFFTYLAAYFGSTFYERDTLIIFDEIQFFPPARGFIKQLVADGRYDFIETGSLVSIKQNINGILIPSEEDVLELNPFDFEEFLVALDETPLVAVMQQAARTLTPLPNAIHRKCMGLFREYMLVGGMPQAVAKYQETRNFGDVDRIKRGILALYRKDVGRFARGYESKVVSIFDDIPAQLSKHEKKFTLASLGKNARLRTYEDAFFWLEDARVANICFNAIDPHVGLGLYRERPTFKCYMADTGLLVSQAFSDKKATSQQIYRDILFDKLEVNEGMFMENIVAQSLKAAGHALYFFSRNNREDSSETMEIDFLITCGDTKSKICPIEVKSTKRYALSSLDKFAKKYGSRIGNHYVLHTKNLSTEGNRVYLPLYLSLYL